MVPSCGIRADQEKCVTWNAIAMDKETGILLAQVPQTRHLADILQQANLEALEHGGRSKNKEHDARRWK